MSDKANWNSQGLNLENSMIEINIIKGFYMRPFPDYDMMIQNVQELLRTFSTSYSSSKIKAIR